MLTRAQEKLIKSLHTKKGRQKEGLCLVEGRKVIELAGDLVQYMFGPEESVRYGKLVTTDTPQEMAAVVKIPKWTDEQINDKDIIVVADGVQDPGNIGSILRLCLGFNAGLVLIESVDVTNPKVIRSSVGAMFQVPNKSVSRKKADEYIKSLDRKIYRLEKTEDAKEITKAKIKTPMVLIAGSEGSGIKLETEADSVYIGHDELLESLNVAHAVAITLYQIRN